MIKSEKLSYIKSINKIKTTGFTEANIKDEYLINSKNLIYLLDKKEISSQSKSTIKDNNNQIYYLDEFIYYIDNNLLKGKKVLLITNYNLPKSDRFFFSDGIFDLKTKKFTASDTRINITIIFLMKKK